MKIFQKISVILPNYNHSKYLSLRINSILNQSYKPFEIIIIDDKSTDNSLEILREFEKKNLIKLLVNKKNIGPVASINKGLKIASGEYFFPCSADDIILKDFFKKTVLKLEENPKTNICMTYPSFYHEKENIFVTQPWLLPFKKEGYYVSHQIIKLQRKNTFNIWSHCSMFRSKTFKDELFRLDFKWFCDWYLFNKESFLNGLYYLPEILAHHRVVSTQYSASSTAKEKTEVIRYMMTSIQKNKKKVSDGFVNSFVFLYYFDLIFSLKNDNYLKIFFSDNIFISKLYLLKLKQNILKYFPMKLKFVVKKFIYNNIINKIR
jgi:glycosyltransferase involved in cell wall biosynthesis